MKDDDDERKVTVLLPGDPGYEEAAARIRKREKARPRERVAGPLLLHLEAIAQEATAAISLLGSLDANPSDRREAIRRITEIRTKTQELFDWLSEARLEDPRN